MDSTRANRDGTTKKRRRRGRSAEDKLKCAQSSTHCDGASSKRKRPTKAPPSQDAIDLSRRLKALSQQKKLSEALRAFDASLSIVDEYHLCSIIDCCSRCGDIASAERIMKEAVAAKRKINVECRTALLKGYCHSGHMDKAIGVFRSMCDAKTNDQPCQCMPIRTALPFPPPTSTVKRDKPNLRTLNTFLRGCMWTATTLHKDARDGSASLSGGVSASETAWDLYQHHNCFPPFDASSYEYCVTVLCQAMQLDKASKRIHELEQLSTSLQHATNPQPAQQRKREALGMCYLSLASSHALAENPDDAIKAARQAIVSAQASRKILKQMSDDLASTATPDRRSESNEIFRVHRLTSIEDDARVIIRRCKPIAPRCLSRLLLTRVLFVSGGGTTSMHNAQQGHDLQQQLVNAAFFSFGLQSALRKLDVTIQHSSGSQYVPLKRKECNRILGAVGLQGGIIGSDGAIDFAKLFSKGLGDDARSKSKKIPLDLELGAGFGEWIVHRAHKNPKRNHVAVELRADRVGKILHRAFLADSSSDGTAPESNRLPHNICVVGAESGMFLRQLVKNGTVSNIFVNHPEPPTQTYGVDVTNLEEIMSGDNAEPAHMLNSSMLRAAAECLRESKHSRIAIVTDNKWYGRLICATFVKLLRQFPNLLICMQLDNEVHPNVRVTETFGGGGSKGVTAATVSLFESETGLSFDDATTKDVGSNGNASNGTSYFDRLWQSGGGSHAEQTTRYFIVMQRNFSKSN